MEEGEGEWGRVNEGRGGGGGGWKRKRERGRKMWDGGEGRE